MGPFSVVGHHLPSALLSHCLILNAMVGQVSPDAKPSFAVIGHYARPLTPFSSTGGSKTSNAVSATFPVTVAQVPEGASGRFASAVISAHSLLPSRTLKS